MNTFVSGWAAGALAVSGAALAQAPDVPAIHLRTEVAAHVQEQFARADANRDGAVTQAEAEALRPGTGARRGGAGGPGRGEGFFTRLDANGDGNVTRAEYDAGRAARAQQQRQTESGRGEGGFARFDANGDGTITRAEFDAVRQQFGRSMGMGRPEGRPMAGLPPGPMALLGPQMFGMADANKDGRVTLQEAQAAALRHFDMADTNRDGKVSPDEHRAMRQKMQEHMAQ